jgi:hypothetical protein
MSLDHDALMAMLGRLHLTAIRDQLDSGAERRRTTFWRRSTPGLPKASTRLT